MAGTIFPTIIITDNNPLLIPKERVHPDIIALVTGCLSAILAFAAPRLLFLLLLLTLATSGLRGFFRLSKTCHTEYGNDYIKQHQFLIHHLSSFNIFFTPSMVS